MTDIAKIRPDDGMLQIYQPYKDGESFCQGDVVRKPVLGSVQSNYGVLVTADCDLVQSKHGGIITYLEVIPVDNYIDEIWAPIELDRIRSQISKTIERNIVGNDVFKTFGDGSISPENLTDWVMSSGAERIRERLKLHPKRDIELIKALLCLERLLMDRDSTPYESLLKSWSTLETKQSAMIASYKIAIDPVRGPSDIFFMPYMPASRNVGYVVRLRRILSIPESELEKSELDWRIGGQICPYYRVGRLTDNLRFSIVQRMAALFSRIGHDTFFETEVASASEMVAEDLFRKSQETLG